MENQKQNRIRKSDRELGEEIKARLSDIEESGILLVVEGSKDKEGLQSLGITNVFALNKMPLFKVVEIVAKRSKECMILTDLDEEGKKLYGKLYHDLQAHGVRVDNSFREFLFKDTTLRQIEGLPRHLRRLTCDYE